jgi:hypothetical protein
MGTPIHHAESALRLGRIEIDEEPGEKKNGRATAVLFARLARENLATSMHGLLAYLLV